MQSLLQLLEEIENFLKSGKAVIEKQPEISKDIFKAGVLPFIRNAESDREYLFVKPASKHGDDPGIQIAKGSRLYKLDGKWLDSKDNPQLPFHPETVAESILSNALREAYEELGLLPENIRRVCEGSIETYRVKGVGEERKMFLLPIEIISRDNFHPPVESGVELHWVTRDNFKTMRPDFAEVASKIDSKIR